ncbi:MAG: hypothetical protein WCP21_12455 [Armatimonadota bacterium]
MSTDSHAGFHDLATMAYYMDSKVKRIAALVKEIEEVQHEFETRFMQSQQRYDNARTAARVWVEAHDWKQPAWLGEAVEKALPPMRDRKRVRIAELKQQLSDLTTQRQGIEQQNDATMGQIKTQNPQLNAREEELKQQETEARDHFYKLTADWKKTGGGLGWLLRPGAVRKAREAMEKANTDWINTNARLAEVRNSWVALKQKTDETETTLQQAWRLRTAEIARLNRELSELERDLEAVAHDAVVEELLTTVAGPQSSDEPEFDKLLAEVVAARDENNSYEAGITQVAELMGLMKGVAEGLTRMAESVNGVQKEQDEHSELARLKLVTPQNVLEFHQIWATLLPLVQDEKQAAEHPTPFADSIKQAVGDRLSDKAIDAMFTAMGDELNRATKEQW